MWDTMLDSNISRLAVQTYPHRHLMENLVARSTKGFVVPYNSIALVEVEHPESMLSLVKAGFTVLCLTPKGGLGPLRRPDSATRFARSKSYAQAA